MRNTIAILCCLSLLSGCAALGKINQVFTSAKNPVIQAGVTLAVSAAVGNDKTKAADIKAVATAVLADASTPAATVSLLEAALNAQIAAHAKNPGELAAFQILSATLEQYLNTYIQTTPQGAITAATLVDVQGVCKAVILATSYYGV